MKFWRKLPIAIAALVALQAAAVPALACQVCYGPAAATSPMVSGVRLGVFLLLGVTICMLGAFAAFFIYLRNRARSAASNNIAAEWTDLQRSSPI